MVNMNMCLVYRFSKLCNNVALYDKLNDSPLVDMKRKIVHALFYHTFQLSFILEVDNDKSTKCHECLEKFNF